MQRRELLRGKYQTLMRKLKEKKYEESVYLCKKHVGSRRLFVT